MGAKTQYYEYNLPANDDYADQNKFNENFESLDTTLHNMQMQIDSAAAGLKYKGAVNYYSNLPNNAEEGDAYTVLYAGSSGTVADGTEYVWGKVSGTLQWIDFSKDSYTKSEVNGLLAAKQATLTAGTGLSFGTGSAAATLGHSNSTTAQSTQEFRRVAYDAQGHITGSTAATTAQAAAINSGITSTDVEQINANKNNILTLKTMGQYTMSGTTNPDTGNTTFAGLFKLALENLGLSTSTLHHYIVYVYTDTVSPTAELLIMYGTFQYNTSITHYAIQSSQIAYYVDNTQGTLAVSGGTAPVKATVRYLD